MNPLATKLNETLGHAAEFLSPAGLRMYFPYGGILGQGAEAKSCDINATIGMAFEEDGTALVMDCFRKGINLDKKAFLYVGSFGLPKLRETWRAMQIEKNPSLAGKTFSNPVVTNALTHGLRITAELFAGPEDEVVAPDLFWDNYALVVEEAVGSKLVHFNTFADGRFDVAAMKKALLAPGAKKVLILNFPNNPTGYTATIEDAAAIVAAVKEVADAGKKIVVVLDDAYFGLVYEKGVHGESLFAEFSDLSENVLAVKLDGTTKEDYVWGLRELRRTASRARGVRRPGIRPAEARQVRGPHEALPRDTRDPKGASGVRRLLRSHAVQFRILHVRQAEGSRRGVRKAAPDREVFDRHDRPFGAHPPRLLDDPHGEARDAVQERGGRDCGSPRIKGVPARTAAVFHGHRSILQGQLHP